MKKKIIISILVVVLLVIGVICFIKYNNNKVVSTITLDINPSIEIDLNKDKRVVNIIALNDDAKEVISDSLKGKSMDEAIKYITDNTINKGYIDEDQVKIILYTKGSISSEAIESRIKNSFGDKNVFTEIIVIDKITKEDEKLAKEYNISPAKVAYIKSIIKDTDSINIEDLANKSVNELNETKNSGLYCDSGYTLEGGWCLKESRRENAKVGQVCPNGYREYNGVCYRIGGFKSTGQFKCRDNKILENKECIKIDTYNAKPQYSCSKGTLMRKGDVNPIGDKDNETYYCIDKSTGKEPTLRCLTNSGHIMVNGKCYNGPAPTINGGCPNGDLLRNGKCYSLDDYTQYVCPDGHIYSKSEIDLCPDTLTYIKPTITGYTCNEENAVLENGKCTIRTSEPAEEIFACEEGCTLFGNDICLNINDRSSKTEGYYCEGEDVKLIKDKCAFYEKVEAKQY